MTFPKKLKIGHKTFTVEKHATSHELEAGYYGLCKHSEQKILIADGLPPEKTAATMIHEILHAIFNEYKICDDEDLEERAVTCLANGLVLFFQSNPEATKWMINKSRENNDPPLKN